MSSAVKAAACGLSCRCDRSRDIPSRACLDHIRRSVRHAIRHLLRRRSRAALIVAVLTVGVAVNVLLWTLLYAVIARPLNVSSPDRLVIVSLTGERSEPRSMPEDIQRQFAAQPVFSSAAAYSGGLVLTATVDRAPVPVTVEGVGSTYFDVLGVGSVHGRFFQPSDAQPGSEPVVVAGHGFWQRVLDGDPAAVGRPLVIEGITATLIGVAPAGFSGMRAEVAPDVIAPLPLFSRLLGGTGRSGPSAQHLIARLADGVSHAQVQAQLTP